ncbi:MAG: AAA family ATPase [Spirochaetes bacterium]|nr:AAA family ATPase [Spirochaetota bacterium]
MITKITLNSVACFKSAAILETDKKVNLIYGLNGTGKSTLSDYLYNRSNPTYSGCTAESGPDEQILVYNQSFIRDYFYEPEDLPGIFTLSKENREAEENVRGAEKNIKKYEEELTNKNAAIDEKEEDFAKKKQNTENRIWEIKNSYAGGDRVLEYCLAGLMGRKESLFNHLLSIEKPSKQPERSTDMLKNEVEAIRGSDEIKVSLLPEIEFSAQEIESSSLFGSAIVGNKSSSFADLITKLENSDWVKKGLEYLPDEIEGESEPCPFCQGKTITKAVIQRLQDYFDESYENNISKIQTLLISYESAIQSLVKKDIYKSNPFVLEKNDEFENLYYVVTSCLNDNKTLIEAKLSNPSQEISLSSSIKAINELNLFIQRINESINAHNRRIENKEAALSEIKETFWKIMRWNYDQTISSYNQDLNCAKSDLADIQKDIDDIESNISTQKKIIQEQQKRTVNIEEAISNINNGLFELGIDGFCIEKHSDVRYRIVRTEECENTFQTLSEGEKMIISFLYFRELCKGRKKASESAHKKIVVIDDPVSSLSHVYTFSVGQMIKNNFFSSLDFEQVFVLTHSLYFFYELTDIKHERRKDTQKLFRMTKNSSGSQINEMRYEEIQNDYQSYWFIVKDQNQPVALIANCMRNIIEYFFNFIEKRDLSAVFSKPALQETKYQAFYRYINRESHSLGQNIFDFKEFNYSFFRDAFHLVFKESGYPEHYDAMMK